MDDRFDAWMGSLSGKVCAVTWCVVMPFFSWDVANYGISLYTLLAVLIGKPRERADRKAMHAKLDDLECAVEKADNANARLEELTEIEIEERRNNGTPSDT